MNNVIEKYNHCDEKLWTYIGKFCADKKIRDELGIAISSNEDCVWYLLFNISNYTHEKQLCGFCCAEEKRNYIYFKHDFVFLCYRGKGIYKKLFNYRADQWLNKTIKATANKQSLDMYIKNNFVIKSRKGKYFNVIKN